jgi:protein downstream neighbor of Son
MPLCISEVEQATEDDLIELSEIERRNVGQVLVSSLFRLV